VAAAVVGVHRTTAQRWLRDADLEALPTTPVLGQEGRAFLRNCVDLHRQRPLRISRILPEAQPPSDDFVDDFVSELFGSSLGFDVLLALAETTLQAARWVKARCQAGSMADGLGPAPGMFSLHPGS
jgi:hypothetical protein